MASDEQKTRVTIYLNGEKMAGGKLLVLSAGTSWEELLNKAGTKLGAIKALKRVFVSNGAEATDVEEILNGDELYFSYGEDFFTEDILFLGEDGAPSGESNLEKKRFIANMANSVVGMASSAYDTSSKFVKEKSPAFVKVTLERVEDKLGGYTTPLVSKVLQIGEWADEKLDGAYQSFSKISHEFLESPLARTVNDSLVVPLKEHVVDPSAAFYKNALENFQQLVDDHRKKGKQGFPVEEFITGLRQKLGKAWNDNLVGPAKTFYAAALERLNKNEKLSNTRQHLDHAWRDLVVANFKTHVQAPAETFYQTALQSYLTLKKTGNGKVTLEEFSAAMRVKMGALWNEHLVAPAKYLYERFVSQTLTSSSSTTALPATGNDNSTAVTSDTPTPSNVTAPSSPTAAPSSPNQTPSSPTQ